MDLNVAASAEDAEAGIWVTGWEGQYAILSAHDWPTREAWAEWIDTYTDVWARNLEWVPGAD